MRDDYRINFQLPAQPLGEAIKQRDYQLTKEERETFGRLAFELDDNAEYKQENGLVVVITEEDCRQIKGAAQALPVSGEVAPSARPDSPVAAPPQSKWTPKVGTRAMFDAGGDWVEDDVIKVIESPIPDGMYRGGHHIVLRHLGEVIYTNDEIRPLEPISTSSDSDGWVAWSGGGFCPVKPGTPVEVRMRRIDHVSMSRGYDFSQPDCIGFWMHHGQGNDIVAYRILP